MSWTQELCYIPYSIPYWHTLRHLAVIKIGLELRHTGKMEFTATVHSVRILSCHFIIDLMWEKQFYWSLITFSNSRLKAKNFQNFEIAKTFFSNIEVTEQFLKQNTFTKQQWRKWLGGCKNNIFFWVPIKVSFYDLPNNKHARLAIWQQNKTQCSQLFIW